MSDIVLILRGRSLDRWKGFTVEKRVRRSGSNTSPFESRVRVL